MLPASTAPATPVPPAAAWAESAPALQPGDAVAAALEATDRLAALLDAEFAALKARDIDAMEQMQASKTAQLQALTDWAAQAAPTSTPSPAGTAAADGASPSAPLPGWSDFLERIGQCRQAHWRNETLLMRQLDAIRGTLRALHAGEDAASVELYDRMGQMARRTGARGYSQA